MAGMRIAALLAAVALIGGCSARSQLSGNSSQGAMASVPAGTTSSGASVSLRADTGSAAGALIGFGIAAALIYDAQNYGMRTRANPFMTLTQPGPAPAPELAPGRKVNEQDCTRPIEDPTANLKCR